MSLDTSYRERRLADRMQDEEFRAAYELAAQEIAQVDSVMRMIDDLRVEAGMSKAQLAREIQKNPASVRRLFTSEVNPELRTVAAMASALDAEVVIKRKRRRRRRTKSTVAA
jgi:ribosome-binding protein aMBF1 (putative translation factor)